MLELVEGAWVEFDFAAPRGPGARMAWPGFYDDPSGRAPLYRVNEGLPAKRT
ncbi:MAG: hypothetical protein FJ029_04860 [Actinobacteria bacterium]|nr:hypothetical protein [Actinomycetota bacterium]